MSAYLFSPLGHDLRTSEAYTHKTSRIQISQIQTSTFSLPPLSSSFSPPSYNESPPYLPDNKLSPTAPIILSPDSARKYQRRSREEVSDP